MRAIRRCELSAESKTGFCGSPGSRKREPHLSRRDNKSQRESACSDSDDIQTTSRERRREPSVTRYPRRGNRGNNDRDQVLVARKIENRQANRPAPPGGCRSSRSSVTNIGFGFFPIDELRLTGGDPSLALAQLLFMPCRRVDFSRISRQILPKCFHCLELLFDGHFIQREICGCHKRIIL
jgi:hypothetical protein